MEDSLRMTIETYNQIAHDYSSVTRDMRPQLEFEKFCHFVVSRGLVLDAGCAWGRDCKEFFEHGFSVVGVDLSSELLKIAGRFAPRCNFLQADLRSLPLKDESVDGVWCCAGLVHLERPEIIKALVEFRRVLKPSSLCYIQVKKGLGEEVVEQSFSQGKARFFTYFQEDEMREYCISSGFSIIDEHLFNDKDRYSGPGSRDQEWICLLIRKT